MKIIDIDVKVKHIRLFIECEIFYVVDICDVVVIAVLPLFIVTIKT